MHSINLKAIIEKQKLDEKEIAAQLFPMHKYPKLALDRIIAGDAFLDSNQVSRLSLLTGIPIDNLYDGVNWKIQSKKNLLVFSTEDYTAELNTETWITKLFDKKSIFHEAIIINGNVPLGEYLIELTNLIIKHRKP